MPVARPSGRLTTRLAGSAAVAMCAVLLVSHLGSSASPDPGVPVAAATASGMLEASDGA